MQEHKQSIICSPMSLHSNVIQFKRVIRGLMHELEPENGCRRSLYKEPLDVKTCPIVAVEEHSVINISEVFQEYMTGAESFKGPHAEKGVFYKYFKGACGYFGVFATRLGIDDTLVHVGTCEDESGNVINCLMVDYLKDRPQGQVLMMCGVPLRVCANCGKQEEKRYKCARCRCRGVHVRYCGPECQRAHWGRHKGVCTGLG